MQGNKNSAIASALFWVLILCIVALYFGFLAASDRAPTGLSAEDADSAAAFAAIEAPASLRADQQGTRATRTKQVEGLGAQPSLQRLDATPPENGRRVVLLANQKVGTRGAVPHSIGIDGLSPAVAKSADNDLADDASAQIPRPSEPPPSSRASQAADRTDDQYSRVGDRDGGEVEDHYGDEEDNYWDYLEISGQVVDEGGRPVSGIGVVAVVRRLFDEKAELGFGGSA